MVHASALARPVSLLLLLTDSVTVTLPVGWVASFTVKLALTPSSMTPTEVFRHDQGLVLRLRGGGKE